MEDSAANSDALVAAARRRLYLLNLDEDQVAQLERTQKPVESITVYAPVSGYVMTRNAYPGQKITAETELYSLVDLSGVWVNADVFEADAQKMRPGLSAQVTVPGVAKPMFARVTYVQPLVDASTRTMKVRLELANPEMRLRPDMWLQADIEVGGARRLSVPSSAVLDGGTEKRVFLDLGDGHYEPRKVETGARFADASGERVEILQGLKAGERIVTSGTFLLNSESQMRGDSR
jgi:RND family efflux transporter MFP subunit